MNSTKENLYSREGQQKSRDDSYLVTYVKQTYMLFAASMLSGTLGAYLVLPHASFVADNYWFIAIPWLLFGFFGLNFVKNIPVVNMISLFLFTFVSGAMITPLLTAVFAMEGGASIVINAFLMTAVSFGGLSLFALKTTKDFTIFGKPLIIGFLIAIGFSLINYFIFQSPLFHIIIQTVFFFIISFMVLYDTQNIIQGNYETPMDGAINLYLDFLNMFITLLQLFSAFNNED
jgi:modulator of FtsH protease